MNDTDTILDFDRLHMTIFRRMETLLENMNEHGIYPTTDFMVGLKTDLVALLREVAFQSAGAASGVFLQEHPDSVMPTEEVSAAVERVLADLCPAASDLDKLLGER